jgi:hypothetical protein
MRGSRPAADAFIRAIVSVRNHHWTGDGWRRKPDAAASPSPLGRKLGAGQRGRAMNKDDLSRLLRTNPKLFFLQDTISDIFDTEPLDVPKLEITLRETIGAVKAARKEAVEGKNREIEKGLNGYEAYLKTILVEIVGFQH